MESDEQSSLRVGTVGALSEGPTAPGSRCRPNGSPPFLEHLRREWLRSRDRRGCPAALHGNEDPGIGLQLCEDGFRWAVGPLGDRDDPGRPIATGGKEVPAIPAELHSG